MEGFLEKSLFTLKQLCYPLMRQMAIGMTDTPLPPVEPRRPATRKPGSTAPIDLNLRGNKRFAWHRQIVRGAH